jgi:hypothetical protein
MSRKWQAWSAAAIVAAGVGLMASGALDAGSGVASVSARPDDDEAIYQKVLDTSGPTLVTVKFVLKVEGGGAEFGGFGDQEMETTGILIDAKGLVLCSNFQLGGAYSMMSRGGGPTVTPSDVKILIGDDTEGKKAKVLTRDTELDLAWVKLDEPSSTDLKHIDMEKGVEPKVGARIWLLARLGKFFDRAPVVNEGKIRGVTEKPRKLFTPSNTIVAARDDLGMPVFNADGAILGIVVIQFPDEESMDAAAGGDMGGGPMILPAAEIVKATKRALEAADKPADPTAPAGDTKEAPKADAPKTDAPPPPAEPKKP